MSFRMQRNAADELGARAGHPTYKGELCCPNCGVRSEIFAGVFEAADGSKYFSGQTLPKGVKPRAVKPPASMAVVAPDLFVTAGMWPAKGAP